MQLVQVNRKILALILLIASGCNDRATRIAIQAADRQANQNQAMMEAQKVVADGSRQLVASDADARRQHIELHRELQSERGDLSTQWSQLEAERQKLAKELRRETLYAPLVKGLCATLLMCATLAFSWYVLARSRPDDGNSELHDLLIQELLGASNLELPTQLTKDESSRLIGHRVSQPSETDKEHEPC